MAALSDSVTFSVLKLTSWQVGQELALFSFIQSGTSSPKRMSLSFSRESQQALPCEWYLTQEPQLAKQRRANIPTLLSLQHGGIWRDTPSMGIPWPPKTFLSTALHWR